MKCELLYDHVPDVVSRKVDVKPLGLRTSLPSTLHGVFHVMSRPRHGLVTQSAVTLLLQVLSRVIIQGGSPRHLQGRSGADVSQENLVGVQVSEIEKLIHIKMAALIKDSSL